MTDVRKLIEKLAAQEAELQNTTFMAPCVRGGMVKARIAGMIYTFMPTPRNTEGWGLFQPVDVEQARKVGEASLMQIEAYLKLLPAFRLRLAFRLHHHTWLAYPANTSDAQQRLGHERPVPVHLVERAEAFDQVVARWDGTAWWFEMPDRRDDPHVADYLRQALRQQTEPDALRLKGLTPEMRTAYSVAFSRTEAYRIRRQQERDEARLGEALAFGGGRLQDYKDRGDYWLVEWTTPNGERHHSAINKEDLTVLSAGICLSDQDQDFDLQSLVGVIEQRPDWM